MKNTKGLIKKDGVREVVCIRGIKICAEYVSLLYDWLPVFAYPLRDIKQHPWIEHGANQIRARNPEICA